MFFNLWKFPGPSKQSRDSWERARLWHQPVKNLSLHATRITNPDTPCRLQGPWCPHLISQQTTASSANPKESHLFVCCSSTLTGSRIPNPQPQKRDDPPPCKHFRKHAPHLRTKPCLGSHDGLTRGPFPNVSAHELPTPCRCLASRNAAHCRRSARVVWIALPKSTVTAFVCTYTCVANLWFVCFVRYVCYLCYVCYVRETCYVCSLCYVCCVCDAISFNVLSCNVM